MTQFFDCGDPHQRDTAIAAAAAAVKSGRLVVMPTDTVYGLGADAFDSGAVTGLLAAKGRGRDMPVGVLVGSWHTIEGLVYTVPHSARELIRAFWPGALSLVVQQAPSLQWDLGDARGTVMLRMPLHPVAIELLREVGPMAVSSANISGRPAATTAEEAQHQLGVVMIGGGLHGAKYAARRRHHAGADLLLLLSIVGVSAPSFFAALA